MSFGSHGSFGFGTTAGTFGNTFTDIFAPKHRIKFKELPKHEDPVLVAIEKGADKANEVVVNVIKKVVDVVKEVVDPKPVPPTIPDKPKPPVGLYLLFGGMTIAIIMVVVIAVE